LSPKLFRVILS